VVVKTVSTIGSVVSELTAPAVPLMLAKFSRNVTFEVD
jgi:hypothetical protein